MYLLIVVENSWEYYIYMFAPGKQYWPIPGPPMIPAQFAADIITIWHSSHTHTHIRIPTHTYMYTHIHTHTHRHTHLHIHAQEHTHIRTHTHTYVCTFTYIYVHRLNQWFSKWGATPPYESAGIIKSILLLLDLFAALRPHAAQRLFPYSLARHWNI